MTRSSSEWILDNKVYQSWLVAQSPAIFHLRGPEGAGKSSISHFLADNLGNSKEAHYPTIASFTFRKGYKSSNRVHSLCLSLITQLLAIKPLLLGLVSDFCPILSPSIQDTGVDEFSAWTLLRATLSPAGRHAVICIINAIHEAEYTEMRPFLNGLIAIQDAAEAPFKNHRY